MSSHFSAYISPYHNCFHVPPHLSFYLSSASSSSNYHYLLLSLHSTTLTSACFSSYNCPVLHSTLPFFSLFLILPLLFYSPLFCFTTFPFSSPYHNCPLLPLHSPLFLQPFPHPTHSYFLLPL